MHLSSRAFVAALIALAACRQAETPQQTAARITAESDSARGAFEAIMFLYGQHFTAGHGDSLVAMYADQAHSMPPNSPAIHGRDGVRQMYTGFFQNGPVGELRFHLEDVVVNGPVAVVRTGYTFAGVPGAPIQADTGSALGVWRKVDGRWLIEQEIWHSDRPVLPPAPAPRRGN